MVHTINAVTPLTEARAILADSFDLKYSKAVERATDKIFDRVRDKIPEIEWPFYAPLIFQINRLWWVTACSLPWRPPGSTSR